MAPPTGSSTAATAFGAPAPSPTSSGAAIKQQFVDLRTAAIAHPHQLLTLTCYVPPTKIGSVIGRRGQSVLTLQREATKRSGGASGSVRVSIVGSGTNAGGSGSSAGGGGGGGGGGPPTIPIPHHAQLAAHNSDPSSLWAPVVVRADPVGAFAAARLLTRDIGGLDCMDDVVVDVPIHRSRHASIIGRKGLTIASLSAEYDVRIMVPQKRGGVQQQHQQQVLSAKQGGGGAGGGDEMLFPGTDESDHQKSGGKGTKNNKGGNKAAAKNEDENIDFTDDDENRQEASDAGASYQSHRPTNVSIVQLEGQLDDVERCLVKVMAIAAGASAGGGGGGAGGGAGGKIKSADEKAKGTDADTGANATGTATETKKMTRAEKLKEKKREKKAKAKAEKEAAAAEAKAKSAEKVADADNNDAEAAPEEEQTGDIPMDIEIKAKDDAEVAVDDVAAASKEPKYSFAVVNATDEAAHLMPSLRKLQALAKSTGAKIRRRKVDESSGGGGDKKKGGEPNAPTDNDNGEDAEKADEEEEINDNGGVDDDDENEDEEEEEGGDAEANDDGAPGKQEITITGKTETVKAAISALEDIFGEGGCTYTLDALKTRKKKNGKRGGHQFRGKKKKKGGSGTKE